MYLGLEPTPLKRMHDAMEVMATSSEEGAPPSLRRLVVKEWKGKTRIHPPKNLTSSRWWSTAPSTADAASTRSTTYQHSGGVPIPHRSANLERVFTPFDKFPVDKYTFEREWTVISASSSAAVSSIEGNRQRKKLTRQVQTVVAVEDNGKRQRRQVLLTCLSKAVVSPWQIEHALRVQQILVRKPGLQRLLRVWDAEKNWVFVQEFDPAWQCVDAWFTDFYCFSEEKLRKIMFQVVAFVYFLHTHELSLAGELPHHDLMMTEDKVTLLFQISFILSGCILVPANERNKAADIAAIGMLMFQLCMLPYSPVGTFNIYKIENAIEEQLSHLSAPCRDLLFDCLSKFKATLVFLASAEFNEIIILIPINSNTTAAELTAEKLLQRKWLRHMDFVSITSKLECTFGTLQTRRTLLHSLLYKLAAFFVTDWFRDLHNVAGAASMSKQEEEENNRQRNRTKVNKRSSISYSGRRFFHGGHHQVGGSTTYKLRRGAVIIPPFSPVMLPSSHDDNIDESEPLEPEATPSIDYQRLFFKSWIVDEIKPKNMTSQALYQDFDYDFPTRSYGTQQVTYDVFEDDQSLVLADNARHVSMDDYMMVPQERRSSLSLGDDDGHSLELQRDVVRSLQQRQYTIEGKTVPLIDEYEDGVSSDGVRSVSKDSNSRSATRSILHSKLPGWAELSMDPVHFSAFGPENVAYRDSFRIDIWAYLKQQRETMLEIALEQNEVEAGHQVQPFYMERGTLITVTMESSEHFNVIGEDSKTFRWRGEINSVSFDLYRKQRRSKVMTPQDEEQEEADELCIARIISGTRVSLLYIRLHVVHSKHNSHTDVGLLHSRLEHVTATVHEIPSQELEVIKPIGSGAFGNAMLARWRNTDTKVVVKTLHSDAYQHSEAVAEFRHEATVMHMLGKHPHVVELLGICSSYPTVNNSPGGRSTTMSEDDSVISLVTEYLPNGSLEDVLGHRGSSAGDHATILDSSSPFSLFSRTVMARDAAHGLMNIHQGQFLHRDIAARNCLVDDHFRVKVCDFGLSRKLNPSGFLFDDERHGFGPLKWMAPESILPPHLFSTQSDSYMFGVLMYEIFSGCPPFPNLSTRDSIALILEGRHVPIPMSLPAAHQALMKQCFDMHPLARPTMDQIYITLDHWIVHDTKTHVYV